MLMQYPNVMIIEGSPGDNGTFRYSGFSSADAENAHYIDEIFRFRDLV